MVGLGGTGLKVTFHLEEATPRVNSGSFFQMTVRSLKKIWLFITENVSRHTKSPPGTWQSEQVNVCWVYVFGLMLREAEQVNPSADTGEETGMR